jgi:hypothetical protein
VAAATEGNALARQLRWSHSVISRDLVMLAAGGALCAGLAAAGTPAVASAAPTTGPPAATAEAFYGHPAAPASGVARAVTTALVRPTGRRPAARRAALVRVAARARAARPLVAPLRVRRALRAGLRRESARRPVAVRSAPAGTPREIAAQLLDADGWAGQFPCLDALWEQESGWNVYAENPSSGAYGIPQALYGSEMASAGPDWESDAATQIRWGLSYIQGRYGSPCGAWDHEEADGWY